MASSTAVATEKKRFRVVWTVSSKGDKKYALLVDAGNEQAVDCDCGDRVFRGRKAGRACKHMREHNEARQVAAQSPAQATPAAQSPEQAPHVETPAQPSLSTTTTVTVASIDQLIEQINRQAGKQVIRRGVPAACPAQQKRAPMVASSNRPDIGMRGALNGNRAFGLLRTA